MTEKSARLAEGEIDALPPHDRVLAVGERRYAVKKQPRWSAPDHDVAMVQAKATRLVRAFQPAEQEDRGQPQRDRDDRRSKILLVAVLVQRHPRAGRVAVDQAGIRREVTKAAGHGGVGGQPQE